MENTTTNILGIAAAEKQQLIRTIQYDLLPGNHPLFVCDIDSPQFDSK